MATARKNTDAPDTAAPTPDAVSTAPAAAEQSEPLAEAEQATSEETAAPAAAEAEAPEDVPLVPGGVGLIFQGITTCAVDGVGLVEPGELKHVPAPLAARLTRGEDPLFTPAA